MSEYARTLRSQLSVDMQPLANNALLCQADLGCYWIHRACTICCRWIRAGRTPWAVWERFVFAISSISTCELICICIQRFSGPVSITISDLQARWAMGVTLHQIHSLVIHVSYMHAALCQMDHSKCGFAISNMPHSWWISWPKLVSHGVCVTFRQLRPT